MSSPVTVFLGLGSNIGDRCAALHQAILAVANRAGEVVFRSSVYQTAPWGNTDQPDYFNQVLQLSTHLSAEQLLQVILEVEKRMGRIREADHRNAPRVIDIDILYFGDQCIDSEKLQVPHPRAHLRNFVLRPMMEIAPEWMDPLSGLTIQQLADLCRDHLPVTRLSQSATSAGVGHKPGKVSGS